MAAMATLPRTFRIIWSRISAIRMSRKSWADLFYESPPFLLRPRPGTTQDMVQAKTALFAYQLDDMHFEEETELTILQGALIGTMVMKWGWHEETVRTKKYTRKAEPEEHTDAAGVKRTIHTAESDEFKIEYDEHLVSRPWIKYCDRRTVLVNRGCRVGDIRKAKNVVYRDYPTYEELDNLRGYEGYDIPSEEDLKTWFMRERVTPSGDNIAVTLAGIDARLDSDLRPEKLQGLRRSAAKWPGDSRILV